MMELSEQVARFLHDRGFGVFDPNGTSGNIFMNTLPDKPDQAIGVYTTGGPMGDKRNEYVMANIQLLIRTGPYDPRPGESAATDIIRALNGFNSGYLVPGGNWIYDVSAIQAAPSSIGRDQTNRFEYSQNFTFEYLI